MRILLVFLDGVGLGEADPGRNVFVASPPPNLTRWLEGASIVRGTAPVGAAGATLLGLDASLGVPGLPQSGTGQAALLTGRNAAQAIGRHFGPWVPASLRPDLRTDSLLARAARAGRRVAFANAYPEEVLAFASPAGAAGDRAEATVPSDAGRGRSRPQRYLNAGPPLAALGAGVLVRHTQALEAGEAIASEITNDAWRERLRRRSVPRISAAEAGTNLARIAGDHDLTLFAHYSTDYAGHRNDLDAAIAALAVVDEFLGGVLDAIPPGTTLLVASDHGNLEDVTTGHTYNPALGLVAGPGHARLAARMASITDVTPAILGALGLSA